MEDQHNKDKLAMLDWEMKKGQENFSEAKDQKKEHHFSIQSVKLDQIKKEIFRKLSESDSSDLEDAGKRQEFFVDFSIQITEMFQEIALFKVEGQQASEFSPKSVEVEHRKTVASLYYLLLLTSSDLPIEDKNDVRFKTLVPIAFQEKLNHQVLEEQRRVVKTLLGDKDKMYMMASMLAIHDAAKLESVLVVIESIRAENGETHTSDHDVALQTLLNNEQKTAELLPTMAALPKEKQELIKQILKAGSEINIGQIGQGLEGNPRQIGSISRVDISSDDIGFWFVENLADTASAAGTTDGSALIMSQEPTWNAWKWSVDSLLKVKKDGMEEIEAYFNLLNQEAKALGVDFQKWDDNQITTLRICMALPTTDKILYDQILQIVSEEQNSLKDVFGINGMTGEQTYRLYYSPSIFRKVKQISGIDSAMSFLNKIAAACKLEVNSKNLQKGEITFQLSIIDKAIDPKMSQEELMDVLSRDLTIDDNLYVKFLDK